MRLRGIAIILLLLAVPIYWFLPLAASHRPSAILSQYLGAAALIAMALAQLLATRFRWLETVFGGLDRIYVLHKWLGVGALAAVVMHDVIGAEIKGLRQQLPFGELGEDLGEVSYNGFLVLVGLTVLTFIPYRWWAWTHRFIGVFFVLSTAHFVLVAKPFSLAAPVSVYVLGFCTLGILAYLYNLVPFGRDGRSYRYEVRQIERTGGATAVTLAPRRQSLRHRPGQFAFVSFDAPGLRESHPFTISSAPRSDGALRFTIKGLGDFTERLPGRLAVGMGVDVSGPFGRFIRRPSAKKEIWIAGGVGVTPFAAWAEAMQAPGPRVHMFYCFRGAANAPYLDLLREVAAHRPEFTLHLIDSSLGQRLAPAAIVEAMQTDLRSTHVHFCGPESLREDLRRSLASHGMAARNFHYEEFEIRTGIGLEVIFNWVLGRFKPKAA